MSVLQPARHHAGHRLHGQHLQAMGRGDRGVPTYTARCVCVYVYMPVYYCTYIHTCVFCCLDRSHGRDRVAGLRHPGQPHHHRQLRQHGEGVGRAHRPLRALAHRPPGRDFLLPVQLRLGPVHLRINRQNLQGTVTVLMYIIIGKY